MRKVIHRVGGAAIRALHGARALSFVDQVLFSAANFVMTITLARCFGAADFATFGIAASIGLVMQGIYRAGFVIPVALLPSERYRTLCPSIAAQHALILGAAVLCTVAAGAISELLRPGAEGSRIALVLATQLLLFFGADLDRVMCLRSGRPRLPVVISSGYFLLSLGVALLGLVGHATFSHVVVLLALAGLLKNAVARRWFGAFRFRRVTRLLAANSRRSLGWGAFGSAAALGIMHGPLYVLGLTAPAINIAAFVATRTPIQPLQVIIRSLDVIDKIASAKSRSQTEADELRIFFKRLRIYGGTSAAFAVATTLMAGPVLHLLFGARYDGFETTLILWTVVIGLICIMGPMETLIHSRRRLKQYAAVQLAASAIAVAAAFPLCRAWLDFGGVLSTLVGCTVVLFGGFMIIRGRSSSAAAMLAH